MADNKPPLPKPDLWDDLYPGRFIKGGNLDRVTVFTVKDVNLERLVSEDGEQVKGVISFHERGPTGESLCIPVNKTNGTCIKAMFGERVSGWVGKRIALFRGEWKGKPAVRIYGSPDLAENISVVIKLPQRRPITMTMHGPSKGRAESQRTEQTANQTPAAERGEQGEGNGT